MAFIKGIPLNNLKAEMKRKEITISEIARTLNKTTATISNKVNGVFEFSISEAIEIQNRWFPYHDLNYLFYQEKEN